MKNCTKIKVKGTVCLAMGWLSIIFYSAITDGYTVILLELGIGFILLGLSYFFVGLERRIRSLEDE